MTGRLEMQVQRCSECSGPPWSLSTKLTAADAQAADHFGFSLSVSGDLALVGAPYDDDLAADSGAASLFERQGSSWDQITKLTANDGGFNNHFGYSVSVSDDTAVIGSVRARRAA